jgi:hypothetical protein
VRIILHIGVEKTGTTAIQAFCAGNAAALRQGGVLYPGGFANRKHAEITAAVTRSKDILKRRGWPTDADPAAVKADVMGRLEAAVRRTRPEALLLSSEHLSSRIKDQAGVAALKAMLSPLSDNFRIVVYLRRQDDLLPSLYSTIVKAGGSGGLEEAEERATWLDFDAMLQPWEAEFGAENIAVGRYPPSDSSLTDDFLRIAGLSSLTLADVETARNVSLDHRNTQLLEAMNALLPIDLDGRLNPQRAGLRQFFERRSTGPAPVMPAEQRREVMARFADSNERVRARHFPQDDRLFPALEATGAACRRDPVTFEDAIDLAADIWKDRAALAARLDAIERGTPRQRARKLLQALRRRMGGTRGGA